MSHLKDLIEEFQRERDLDPFLEEIKQSKNIIEAIEIASTSKLNNKKHSHQFRIPNIVLTEFAEKLISINESISNCTSFEEIHELILQNKILGIGSLTVYDTANRIGFFLGFEPKDIHLHSGTKKGLENLMEKKFNSIKIKKNELPKELKNSSLKSWEIEVFLCVMKDRFKDIKQ